MNSENDCQLGICRLRLCRRDAAYGGIVGYAFTYAPPEATRSMIVEGIGRGIARAAAHEFAHQFVPRLNIHASRDPESYEYATADRFAQCYGPIRWDLAKDALAKALGVRAAPAQVDLRHGESP